MEDLLGVGTYYASKGIVVQPEKFRVGKLGGNCTRSYPPGKQLWATLNSKEIGRG